MKRFILPSLALGIALFVGCSAADSIDNQFDCSGICDRYQTCFDSKYDVSACSDRCHDKSGNDQDFQRKADSCKACIDDQASCTDATFKCGTECAGIIP